jgi:Abi-like protein
LEYTWRCPGQTWFYRDANIFDKNCVMFVSTTPATLPVEQRTRAGFLLPLPPVLYSKPALPFAQQIALLQSRGLVITDVAEAKRTLARLSYYRLAAYFLSFQTPGDPSHSFHPGTTLETVVRLYEFDEALRSLVFRATGTIEIALRAQLAYQNAIVWGPHWYEDSRTAINS